MTAEKLQQVEEAKEALHLAIDLPKVGYKEWSKACGIISSAGFVLVERVIELEEQLKRYEWSLAQTEALVMSHEGHIAKQDAQIAKLKEWQERAMEYVKEGEAVYKALIKMGPPPSDDPERLTRKADVATTLITEAQGGVK